MKKISTLLALVFCLNAKAQTYVTIPDANFATYLQGVVPAAMNGNQLNTSSTLVTTTIHSMDVTGLNIADLTGLQYFTSLTSFTCNANSLTSLPALPSMLTFLSCDANVITSLPALPSSLSTLLCDGNALTSLPALPNSLTHLHCESNHLTSLPTLPNSLTYLYCNVNSLTSLPTMPNSLQWVECYYNQLTSLPAFSSTQVYLDCSYNYITTMPTFPSTLQNLYCNNNKLTALPAFPNSFSALDCSINNITGNIILPNNLTYLRCRVNHINGFSSFPNTLIELICDSNNVSCFPIIPNNFPTYGFSIDNNPFSCLPNYISAMNAADLATPLCAAGNSNGCAISGINRITDVSNQATIYPNPTQNIFTIETSSTDKQTLQVFDVNGKLVLTQTINGNTNIDASNLADGVYNLSLQNTSGVINKRLVIVR